MILNFESFAIAMFDLMVILEFLLELLDEVKY